MEQPQQLHQLLFNLILQTMGKTPRPLRTELHLLQFRLRLLIQLKNLSHLKMEPPLLPIMLQFRLHLQIIVKNQNHQRIQLHRLLLHRLPIKLSLLRILLVQLHLPKIINLPQQTILSLSLPRTEPHQCNHPLLNLPLLIILRSQSLLRMQLVLPLLSLLNQHQVTIHRNQSLLRMELLLNHLLHQQLPPRMTPSQSLLQLHQFKITLQPHNSLLNLTLLLLPVTVLPPLHQSQKHPPQIQLLLLQLPPRPTLLLLLLLLLLLPRPTLLLLLLLPQRLTLLLLRK